MVLVDIGLRLDGVVPIGDQEDDADDDPGDDHDDDPVPDLPAALLVLGLGGQARLSGRALAGSLLAGHGPRPYPIREATSGRPEASGNSPGRRVGQGPGQLGSAPPVVDSLVRMPLVVQKFGGTSVGDADRIRAVADHIARTRRQGADVVAVVSAMGKTTDDLIHLANSVSTTQPLREYDMLVSTGERISMSLLVMALADLGVAAASFTGSQVGIITDNDHTRARIKEVRGDRLRRHWPRARSRSSPASRASRPTVRSRRSAGGVPTPPRSPWPRCWTPTCARSTPTSPACSPPIPGSCPRPIASTGSPSTRCSRWRRAAGGS